MANPPPPDWRLPPDPPLKGIWLLIGILAAISLTSGLMFFGGR